MHGCTSPVTFLGEKNVLQSSVVGRSLFQSLTPLLTLSQKAWVMPAPCPAPAAWMSVLQRGTPTQHKAPAHTAMEV